MGPQQGQISILVRVLFYRQHFPLHALKAATHMKRLLLHRQKLRRLDLVDSLTSNVANLFRLGDDYDVLVCM